MLIKLLHTPLSKIYDYKVINILVRIGQCSMSGLILFSLNLMFDYTMIKHEI